MAKSATYFSHDCNARSDEKLLAVRMRHKAEGYGVYFMIIEMLAEEPTHTLGKDYNLIAFELRVDSGIVKAIVEDFGLFQFTEDGERLYSESLMARLSEVDNLRKKRSEAGRRGALNRWQDSNAMAKPLDCNSNAMAKPLKKMAKENKEKEIIKENDVKEKNAAVAGYEVLKIDQLYNELREELSSSTQIAESASRRFQLPPAEILIFLGEFVDKLVVDGTATDTRSNFRRHFNNWLSIQLQNKKNSKNILKNDGSDKPKRERSVADRLHTSKNTGGYYSDI